MCVGGDSSTKHVERYAYLEGAAMTVSPVRVAKKNCRRDRLGWRSTIQAGNHLPRPWRQVWKNTQGR